MVMTSRQKKFVDILRDEPVKLAHWCGFDKMGDLHNSWIKDMVYGKEDSTLLAHRNSYKTTCVSFAIAIDVILFPNTSTLFVRKTDEDIKEIIEQVKKILMNPATQHFVNNIYGVPLELAKANMNEVTTNLVTRTSGTVQLMGVGIKGNLTGKHFDRIRTDDIVTIKDRISRAEREFTKLVYQELQNIVNRGGKITNTATPWHKEDCIQLMPNITRMNCYETGILSKENIDEKREKMTPSLFAANYELQHIADADALFSAPQFEKDVEQLYDGVCHIDAAYGGSDGTAFTILKLRGDKIVMFGKRWDKHIDDCLNEIYMLREKYRAGTIYLEDNADKGYLRKRIKDQGHSALGYHESTNKFIKISSHLRSHWKDIRWIEDTDPSYLSEILDYTENSTTDDCADSAASLIRKMMKNKRSSHYIAVK